MTRVTIRGPKTSSTPARTMPATCKYRSSRAAPAQTRREQQSRVLVQRRSGTAATGDSGRCGVDAYHAAFRNYVFCAGCDFENGFLTLLTEKLWTSEVLRQIGRAHV